LIAELGVDMGRFASAAHLMSWARFCPQVHESAGKTKPKGRGKGNPWLAGTLGNIVAAAARTDSFLGRATGGSPNAAANNGRWSRSATRC
jgi:transposase